MRHSFQFGIFTGLLFVISVIAFGICLRACLTGPRTPSVLLLTLGTGLIVGGQIGLAHRRARSAETAHAEEDSTTDG